MQVAGLCKARAVMRRLLQRLERHGWARRDIYLLGFSQGGTVALDFALHEVEPIGAAISISGSDTLRCYCYVGIVSTSSTFSTSATFAQFDPHLVATFAQFDPHLLAIW